jgi:hypothetical protein
LVPKDAEFFTLYEYTEWFIKSTQKTLPYTSKFSPSKFCEILRPLLAKVQVSCKKYKFEKHICNRHVLHSLYYKTVTANLYALITDPKQADKTTLLQVWNIVCVPPGDHPNIP